ncbi:unnamed protein product [Tenebrio molitor]|nr:unnamed protein product [Tenebrio molitor]
MKGLPLKNKIYFPKKYVFNENLSLKFIIKKHVCILSNCKTAMVAFFLAHAEAADNPYRKAENAVKPELKVPAWHTGHVPPY